MVCRFSARRRAPDAVGAVERGRLTTLSSGTGASVDRQRRGHDGAEGPYARRRCGRCLR